MVINRIGDMGVIIAMIVMYDMFESLEFNTIFDSIVAGTQKYYEVLGYNLNGYEIISILLLIGAIGKSAQIGLHT